MLPEMQRACLLMRVQHDVSYEEVAQVWKSPYQPPRSTFTEHV